MMPFVTYQIELILVGPTVYSDEIGGLDFSTKGFIFEVPYTPRHTPAFDTFITQRNCSKPVRGSRRIEIRYLPELLDQKAYEDAVVAIRQAQQEWNEISASLTAGIERERRLAAGPIITPVPIC